MPAQRHPDIGLKLVMRGFTLADEQPFSLYLPPDGGNDGACYIGTVRHACTARAVVKRVNGGAAVAVELQDGTIVEAKTIHCAPATLAQLRELVVV